MPAETESGSSRVIITSAGRESLVFRELLRQALPMLQQPERFTQVERCDLADTISLALEENFDMSEEYEPGCEVEVEEDPW